MKARHVVALWIGITCASFSRARDSGKRVSGTPRGWSGPLRGDSAALAWGLPGLGEKDLAKVRDGNRLARWACRFIRLGLKFGVPVLL